MQRIVLSENGNPEIVHLPGPDLALSSGPLWTMHNHFYSRRNPQNVRTDAGIFLEFCSYTVSCGLRTSRLVMASLFLEKIFFKPQWEYALAHSGPLLTTPSVLMQMWQGWGRGFRLFLAHHLSCRCGWERWWWYLETPLNTPIGGVAPLRLEKAWRFPETQGEEFAQCRESSCLSLSQALLPYKCVDRL